MICFTSRGSDYSEGSYMHKYDFQEPYLRAIFGHAGITDIQFINAQPLDMDPAKDVEFLKNAKDAANASANEFV